MPLSHVLVSPLPISQVRWVTAAVAVIECPDWVTVLVMGPQVLGVGFLIHIQLFQPT